MDMESKFVSDDKDIPHLYSITGSVLDINTLLINRNAYRSMAGVIDNLMNINETLQLQIDELSEKFK